MPFAINLTKFFHVRVLNYVWNENRVYLELWRNKANVIKTKLRVYKNNIKSKVPLLRPPSLFRALVSVPKCIFQCQSVSLMRIVHYQDKIGGFISGGHHCSKMFVNMKSWFLLMIIISMRIILGTMSRYGNKLVYI